MCPRELRIKELCAVPENTKHSPLSSEDGTRSYRSPRLRPVKRFSPASLDGHVQRRADALRAPVLFAHATQTAFAADDEFYHTDLYRQMVYDPGGTSIEVKSVPEPRVLTFAERPTRGSRKRFSSPSPRLLPHCPIWRRGPYDRSDPPLRHPARGKKTLTSNEGHHAKAESH